MFLPHVVGVVNDLIPGVDHVNVGHSYINVSVQSVTDHSNPALRGLIECSPVVLCIKPCQIQIHQTNKLSEKLGFYAVL